jgi:hypothetical protein
MTTLTELWRAFNAAYDAYPGDPLHPARVAARERLWLAQHVGWVDEVEADCDCGF